jgi:hypothetical protein
MPLPMPARVVALIAGLIVSCLFFVSCVYNEGDGRLVYVYPLEDEVKTINTVAAPAGAYRVQPGDTPGGIAAKFCVDYDVFAEMNGIEEGGVIRAGELLIIPRVAYRDGSEPVSERPSLRHLVAEPRPSAETVGEYDTIVGADGAVRAGADGKVIAVFRKYTSLGDVVIIENESDKFVYSGSFEPAVVKGAAVSKDAVIARGARPGGVKLRVFAK